MKLHHLGFALILAATAFGAGCASGLPGSNPFDEAPGRGEQEVKFFITNLAFSDVTVFGITNGGRRRLGRITGKKEVVFSMPLTVPTPMHLEIDFLAGPRCETERLMVDPGDHMELIIQNENAGWRCYGGSGA